VPTAQELNKENTGEGATKKVSLQKIVESGSAFPIGERDEQCDREFDTEHGESLPQCARFRTGVYPCGETSPALETKMTQYGQQREARNSSNRSRRKQVCREAAYPMPQRKRLNRVVKKNVSKNLPMCRPSQESHCRA